MPNQRLKPPLNDKEADRLVATGLRVGSCVASELSDNEVSFLMHHLHCTRKQTSCLNSHLRASGEIGGMIARDAISSGIAFLR